MIRTMYDCRIYKGLLNIRDGAMNVPDMNECKIVLIM